MSWNVIQSSAGWYSRFLILLQGVRVLTWRGSNSILNLVCLNGDGFASVIDFLLLGVLNFNGFLISAAIILPFNCRTSWWNLWLILLFVLFPAITVFAFGHLYFFLGFVSPELFDSLLALLLDFFDFILFQLIKATWVDLFVHFNLKVVILGFLSNHWFGFAHG